MAAHVTALAAHKFYGLHELPPCCLHNKLANAASIQRGAADPANETRQAGKTADVIFDTEDHIFE
jgi:hypothetical protein